MSRPIAVADEGDGRGLSGLFFFGRKDPPDHRRHSEHVEIIGGHDRGEDAPGVVLLADADHGDVVARDPGEDRVLIANVAQCRIRKGAEGFRVLRVLGENLDHFVGPGIARRREQQRVDQAEHGGVGADAESEHEDGGDRETRRLEELPESEAKIPDHTGEMRRGALLDSNFCAIKPCSG